MIKDHDLLIKLKELDIIVEGTKFMPRAPSQIASNILQSEFDRYEQLQIKCSA